MGPAWILSNRRCGSPSFSRPTMTFSRRWPSSEPPAASGPSAAGAIRPGVWSAALSCPDLLVDPNRAAAGEQPGPHRVAGPLRHSRRRPVARVNGYDEALSLPSEESARMALRIQQILALESGVARRWIRSLVPLPRIADHLHRTRRATTWSTSMRRAASSPRSTGPVEEGDRRRCLPSPASVDGEKRWSSASAAYWPR